MRSVITGAFGVEIVRSVNGKNAVCPEHGDALSASPLVACIFGFTTCSHGSSLDCNQ
jgi:hypothetical protein